MICVKCDQNEVIQDELLCAACFALEEEKINDLNKQREDEQDRRNKQEVKEQWENYVAARQILLRHADIRAGMFSSTTAKKIKSFAASFDMETLNNGEGVYFLAKKLPSSELVLLLKFLFGRFFIEGKRFTTIECCDSSTLLSNIFLSQDKNYYADATLLFITDFDNLVLTDERKLRYFISIIKYRFTRCKPTFIASTVSPRTLSAFAKRNPLVDELIKYIEEAFTVEELK